MGFNYFDELKSGTAQSWVSYLNEQFLELNAPEIKIFKIDKKTSIVDPLYGEAAYKRSRIYLPPFAIRAFHLDNPWKQISGEGTMPYLETQENLQFVLNFEKMVQVIRDLKNAHISDISIDYTGSQSPSLVKEDTHLVLKINDSVLKDFDLTNSLYNTTKKLSSSINSITNFSTTLSGENDSSLNLVSFSEIRFRKNKINIYSEDKTYQNMTDIIEAGDLVLTNKWFLYEVLENLPGGDFGWNYATFILNCNIRSIDKAQLPSNYIEMIKRHEYGLRDKVIME